MILYAYSIYDRKALQYHAPFFAVADGAALRSFSDLANDKGTSIGRHPTDFVLYKVGAFNDADGSTVAFAPIEHLADAQSFLPKQGALFAIEGDKKETA